MNWVAAIPALISLFQTLSGTLGTPTPRGGGPVPSPDQAIKDLQRFLNAALSLNPPLAVDGWLGPRTDAAIEQGIAVLRDVLPSKQEA